jgi:hypothetical protein
MSVHIQNQRVPIIWLQAERGIYDQGKIQFSADRSKLRKSCDPYAMATTFATLNFRHVIDLLNNINAVNSRISIYDWWWASTNFGMLHQGFGGSWVKAPSPIWAESSVKFFTTHADSIASVQRQFAIQYPNAKRISLRDPESWKNEFVSLSQPADFTLAGMKRKIAPIGSAPTPPQEHLQQFRSMRSPTANRGVPAVQPANPSSTRTPPALMSPKEASTGVDKATSILQGVLITAPSPEALGQGPHASPPFSNPQANPFETPNLTGRIVRLGSTPMARGGYSSVWRGSLISTTSDDPHRTLQVLFSVDGSRRMPVLTTDSLGCPQGASCFVYG